MRNEEEIVDIWLNSMSIHGGDELKSFIGKEINYKSIPNFMDIDKATRIIEDTIEHKDPILLISDFDADGTSAAALGNVVFVDILGYDSSNFRVIFNNRMNRRGVTDDLLPAIYKEIDRANISLIITSDHGSDNRSTFEKIKERYPDIKIIVTDHHHIKSKVHEVVDAFINPERKDNIEKDPISGCAVLYTILFKFINEAPISKIDSVDYIKLLVAITTIVDVVPLNCITNRKYYLEGIDKAKDSLLYKSIADKVNNRWRIDINEKFIGWTVGPLINCASRMTTTPDFAYNWITAKNLQDSIVAYGLLDAVNTSRKRSQGEAIIEANEYLERYPIRPNSPIIIVINRRYSGVAGIVASSIGNKYNLPCLVLTYDRDLEIYGGSARAIIKGYDFKTAMDIAYIHNRKIFVKRPAGHSAAFGCSIKIDEDPEVDNVNILRELLSKLSTITDEMTLPTYRLSIIDIEPKEITYKLRDLISKYAPFGRDWEQPIFRTKSRVRRMEKRSDDKSMIMIDNAVPIIINCQFDEVADSMRNAEIEVVFSIDQNSLDDVQVTAIMHTLI